MPRVHTLVRRPLTGEVGLEPVEVLQEQQPRRLLRVVELGGAARLFPQNVVDVFEGLVIDYAHKKKVNVLIRGLRMISDFEYEFQMAMMNRELDPNYETVFLMSSPSYSFVSSRMIKEIVKLGGDVSPFVPPAIVEALKGKQKHG